MYSARRGQKASKTKWLNVNGLSVYIPTGATNFTVNLPKDLMEQVQEAYPDKTAGIAVREIVAMWARSRK